MMGSPQLVWDRDAAWAAADAEADRILALSDADLLAELHAEGHTAASIKADADKMRAWFVEACAKAEAAQASGADPERRG